MSFSNGLQDALTEMGGASFQRSMARGGPPQWSGARDPVPANAGVNASVNGDLGVATGEALAYFALKQTAPGAQVSIARGRYRVMSSPSMKAGKLFVSLTDLGSPTGDRYTLVVPTDANILPKLVRQGSVQGKISVVNVANVEDIEIDGVPVLEFSGQNQDITPSQTSMLHALKEMKVKMKMKKKAKMAKGDDYSDDDEDDGDDDDD